MKKYLICLMIIGSLFLLAGCSKDEVVPDVETAANKTEPADTLASETKNITEIKENIPAVKESIPLTNKTPEQAQIPVETKTNVKITSFGFDPKELRIKKGTTVSWTQNDDKMRNSKHQLSEHFREFRSGYITYGGSFNHTFNKTGEFGYIDVLHTMFRGTIIVED